MGFEIALGRTVETPSGATVEIMLASPTVLTYSVQTDAIGLIKICKPLKLDSGGCASVKGRSSRNPEVSGSTLTRSVGRSRITELLLVVKLAARMAAAVKVWMDECKVLWIKALYKRTSYLGSDQILCVHNLFVRKNLKSVRVFSELN